MGGGNTADSHGIDSVSLIFLYLTCGYEGLHITLHHSYLHKTDRIFRDAVRFDHYLSHYLYRRK